MAVHHDGKIWSGANSDDDDDDDDNFGDDSDGDNDGEVSIFCFALQWKDMAGNSSPKFFHLSPCTSRQKKI